MKAMILQEVLTAEDEKRFIAFPEALYTGLHAWIRPLDEDIRAVFDREANKTFEYGECNRWLLVEQGNILGRIAAFVTNPKAEGRDASLAGGVGFFECVDRQDAANALFDGARQWLAEKGATYMDGPINFGRRDKWWGLLTKGFDEEPNYQCTYNPPYYQRLFEAYGFRTYYEQFTFRRRISDPVSPRLEKKAHLIAEDPSYTFTHFRTSEFDRFATDIIEVYNKAWVKHEGVNPISPEQGKDMLKRLKPILDERIIWIAYFRDSPVAIFVNIPEINQILKHLNGSLKGLGKIKFLWYKKMRPTRKVLGMIFGVVPEHQGKGVDGAIIQHFAQYARANLPYEFFEMNGIGDFNPKMVIVAKQVGGDVTKIHTTYRFLFDPDAPFERMARIR